MHLIQELRPFGDLLQVGFVNKKTASELASFFPKSHTIIESDPLILEKAASWAASHPHVLWIREPWQAALGSIDLFDSIYCDLSDASSAHSELTRMRYSEHDLEILCESAVETAPGQIFHFLHELAHHGQIDSEQMEKMIHKYKLKGSVPKLKKNCAQTLECLKICLDSRLRPGGLCAAALDDLAEAYNDPLFFQMAADPYVDFHFCEGGIVVEKISV